MIRNNRLLDAWGSDAFQELLRQTLERLPHQALPLQQALRHSSQVSDEPIQAMVIRVEETAEAIVAEVGIFYSGLVGGCSCADDPTPDSPLNEYCRLEVRLDRQNAGLGFSLLPEESA